MISCVCLPSTHHGSLSFLSLRCQNVAELQEQTAALDRSLRSDDSGHHSEAGLRWLRCEESIQGKGTERGGLY